ncbi:hypothetical protein GIB67_019718 [Kingdonia uniflora]|uniref:Uncharacterized protein n=1 Tax=Kingdonia uniflora TaxID=39325 RepID=A0A7J7MK48_9MAGN|nr:hypothetical protein GIB67_019718 [Kingdonia uniflora]
MIIKHEYMFNKVEHEYFKEFVNKLNLQFKQISRNTLKSDYMRIYQEEKGKLYKFLDKLNSWISCTSELNYYKHTKDAFVFDRSF